MPRSRLAAAFSPLLTRPLPCLLQASRQVTMMAKAAAKKVVSDSTWCVALVLEPRRACSEPAPDWQCILWDVLEPSRPTWLANTSNRGGPGIPARYRR